MKRLHILLPALCCIVSAAAQLRTETILPRKTAPEKPAAVVYDSLTNIRVNGDAAYYKSLTGQRILFYPLDIHADLRHAAYCNFLAETPAAVRIDTAWLRKPRKKTRPEDFRLDTVYSNVYSPRHFLSEPVTPLGCSLYEARDLGTMDYSKSSQTGWFTPAEAIEGRSFEIIGVERRKIGDSELLMFKLRDEEGETLYWFAHAGDDSLIRQHERYPVVIEGALEKYRSVYLGKDFFLTARKPEAPGYVSEYFGLQVNTMQGETGTLQFGTEMRCTDVRLIGDGTGYAVPSFLFEKKTDSVQIYIPLTRYPTPFGVEGYTERQDRAFVDELVLTPAEVIYAQRAEEERQREEARIEREKEQKERKAMLCRKYGKAAAELILQNKVRIGMTKEMCREAWGSPEDINRSSGSWGVHEQWVYGVGSYLYFENGVLSSIQN